LSILKPDKGEETLNSIVRDWQQDRKVAPVTKGRRLWVREYENYLETNLGQRERRTKDIGEQGEATRSRHRCIDAELTDSNPIEIIATRIPRRKEGQVEIYRRHSGRASKRLHTGRKSVRLQPA